MAKGPRNIVLCSDGTGNSGAKWNGTNVWKTYVAVERHDHEEAGSDKPRQLAFYDQGVGTSRLSIQKALGGAFGLGLGENIRQLYTALAKNYRDGDKVFIFGFSRGAFTARSLAGMISDVELIDGRDMDNEVLDRLVAQAYKAYRSDEWEAKREQLRADCESEGTKLQNVRIHFVGVWDTVGAMGVPIKELRDVIYWIARRFLRPHNVELTEKMDHAYHALAIDDDRHSFWPTLYDEKGATTDVEQVWFAGAHSNVGGGYPRQGLSDVACDWMMDAAERCGLRFTAEARDEIRRESDVHSTLYDSRSGPAAYYRYLSRHVCDLCEEAGTAVKVHDTALDRIELATDDYAPLNLPSDFEVVGEDPRQSKRFTECLASCAEERAAGVAPAWREIYKRRRLYKIFLVCTLLVAALGIALMVSPERTVEVYRQYSVFYKAWTSFWSSMATEAPGWIATAGGWIGKALVALTPGPLENLVKGLLQLPEAIVAIAIIAFVLIKMKKKRLARMKHMGLDLWRKAFPE